MHEFAYFSVAIEKKKWYWIGDRRMNPNGNATHKSKVCTTSHICIWCASDSKRTLIANVRLLYVYVAHSATALLQIGTRVCMGSEKSDAKREKKSEQRHNICMNHLVCVVLKIVNVKIKSQSPGAQSTRIIVTCLMVSVAFREQYQKQLLT